MRKCIFIFSLVCLFGVRAVWAVSPLLAPCFTNNMVLQRNQKVELWGQAQAGQEVLVSLQGQTAKAIATANGAWTATLDKLKAGGPFELKVAAGNQEQVLREVFVGEVWLAGGQSNMGFRLNQCLDADRHMSQAQNDNVKFLYVPWVLYQGHKVKDSVMQWRDATTPQVGQMSAVAYFFAQKLQKELGVPVGVICCYKGGTAAEVWMSTESLESTPDFAPILTKYRQSMDKLGAEGALKTFNEFNQRTEAYNQAIKRGEKNLAKPTEPMTPFNPKRPASLYYTMLQRVIPYTVKGVIWYQGEANAPRAEQYRSLFPALIDLWRTDFQNPQMPFYFVQLSNYQHPSYGDKPYWAELREAQLHTWQTVPNTAMAVSIDVGEQHDIHPINKQPVGERLAASALALTYGKKLPYSGPVYKQMKVKGNQIVLQFDFVYKGLTTLGNQPLAGFEVCGPDKVFVPAVATIGGDKVVVHADQVPQPIAVRYGWSNWTAANLFNKDGFPATPFRTDDFDLLTKGEK